MRCPKCQGIMILDLARWDGDVDSHKCLICGNRAWIDPVVVKPNISPKAKDEMSKEDKEILGRKISKLRLEQRRIRLVRELEIINNKEMRL